MGYSLTSAPPGTDPLPHRLEAHSMVFNYIDMLGVAAAAAGYGSVKEMPRPFQAQADAESRKVLRAGESPPSTTRRRKPVTTTPPSTPAHRIHRTGLHNMTTALSVAGLKSDVGKVNGVNAKVAVLLTRLVGTMWCAYVFAAIALISLPDAIKGGKSTLISWIAQTFLQLVLLSVIMVGQAVQSAAADARAAQTFADVERIMDALNTKTAGGLQEVLAAVKNLSVVGPTPPSSDER